MLKGEIDSTDQKKMHIKIVKIAVFLLRSKALNVIIKHVFTLAMHAHRVRDKESPFRAPEHWRAQGIIHLEGIP